MKSIQHYFSILSALLLSILFSHSLFSQVNSFELRGKVLDAKSKEALPFAHIYSVNQYSSLSTSDQNGYFSIQVKEGDLIKVSFIGYQSSTIAISDKDSSLEVLLRPAAVQLSIIEIEEESDFLYAMLSRCKKSNAYYSKWAKTYLFQESSLNGTVNEMIEAYYNGKFLGYDLQELELKNGRIGLQAFEDRYFINKQSSNAIMMHQMLLKNRFFPEDPIGLGKRKIKKDFVLEYSKKYLDEENRLIYVIDFKPRKRLNEHFSGTVWLDSSSANIQKIELNVRDAKPHPFVSLFNNKKIERLDLFIRKSFLEIEGRSYPREIDFEYDLIYEDSLYDSLKVNSRTLLYAFDYEQQFDLPFLKFPENLEDDYRKINALPYNREFWNHKPFEIDDQEGKIDGFFRSNNTLRARNAVIQRNGEQRSFFEHPYVLWNGNRIRMRDNLLEESLKLPTNKEDCLQMENDIQVDLYHFEVQLFMDMNRIADSLNILTAAIFDPFESYYHIEHDEISAVFINIYFDLAEIQNRKLVAKLKGIQSRKKANEEYHKLKEEFEALSKDYFSSVQRGKDLEELKRWNDLVRIELGIDNFEIFNLKKDSN